MSRLCLSRSDVSQRKQRFIVLAIEEAKKSTMLFKHGCVAVWSGKAVAAGYNQLRNYSKHRFVQKCYCLHAEVACLMSIKPQQRHMIKKITLFIVRLNNDWQLMPSQPCTQCTQLLKNVGIKKVYYSTYNNVVYKKVGDYTPQSSFGFLRLQAIKKK
jgi:deoxycytidylate deaminase